MPWQDVLISAGTIVLMTALIPSIISDNKPAIQTSVLTGSVLLSFSVTYFTLSLWFATATTAMTALLWFVLAAQVWKRNRIKES